MHTYWMTYRLADDGQFVARSKQINTILNSVSEGARWAEPHTFFIFKSKLGINDVIARFRPALDERKDMLLLGMTEFKEARVLGVPQHAALYALVPHAQDA